MKKKPYLYCPFPQAQFALAVFEVLQALAWIFVGVCLQEFISGKNCGRWCLYCFSPLGFSSFGLWLFCKAMYRFASPRKVFALPKGQQKSILSLGILSAMDMPPVRTELSIWYYHRKF